MSFTSRDFKNSARDVATSGRPSQGGESMAVPNVPDPEVFEAADDGRLVELAMYRALLAPHLARNRERSERREEMSSTDAADLDRAEQWITDLQTKIGEAELALAVLGGFVGECSLGGAAVNSTAIKLGEARERLPVLRQAVRDMEGGS